MPILFLITVIDLIGFGMLFPLFPLFKVKFGLNNLEIGYIASMFAVCGIFGSIFWGMLSDKIGRRLPLALPLLIVAVIYYFTGRTNDLTIFIILRGLAGFFASNFSVAFAAVADLSTPENRFKNMGIISSSFSLGFVLGPALGGYLAGNGLEISDVHFSLPFDVSAGFNILAAILTFTVFKETLSTKDRKQKHNLNLANQLKSLFASKNLRFFTFLMVMFTSMMSGIQVFFGVFLHEAFYFSAQDIGIFWAILGIIMTVVQLNISKIFSSRQALIVGFAVYSASIGLFLIAETLVIVIIGSLAMAVGIAMVSPSINARLSLEGKKNQQGLLLGIGQAMGSFGRVIGPNIIGLLFFINHNLAWATISVLAVLMSFLIANVIKK